MQAILTTDAYGQIAELARHKFERRSLDCRILMNMSEAGGGQLFIVDKLKDESMEMCHLLLAYGGVTKVEEGLNIIFDISYGGLTAKLRRAGRIEDVEVIKMGGVKSLDSAKDLLHVTQEYYPYARSYRTANGVPP